MNWFDPNSEEAKQRVQTQNIADQVELMRFIRKWGRFKSRRRKDPSLRHGSSLERW